MATTTNTIAPQTFLSLSSPKPKRPTSLSYKPTHQILSRPNHRARLVLVGSVSKELDVIPVQSSDATDQQEGVVIGTEREVEGGERVVSQVVGGFSGEGRLSFEGAGGFSSAGSSLGGGESEGEDLGKWVDRGINAAIVLAAGSFAITKLLTIDQDYWHGWTLYEIVRYAPQHNWSAYEEALKTNPVFAKMMISGVVYSLGDWIAQCCEGKPLFEFDRTRMFRSGLVGFTLHGSLSHYYYQFCEELIPYHDWWVVIAKVVFDQTAWAALWNSIYFIALGFLRLESPVSIFNEWKATFWPMLTFMSCSIPVCWVEALAVRSSYYLWCDPLEQRLLWVDCVELIWVTILSTYSNEKSEARISEAEVDSSSPSIGPPEVEK
ncbi:hypothetical protein C3L33_11673, partial [Rhododendron williamsianum]